MTPTPISLPASIKAVLTDRRVLGVACFITLMCYCLTNIPSGGPATAPSTQGIGGKAVATGARFLQQLLTWVGLHQFGPSPSLWAVLLLVAVAVAILLVDMGLALAFKISLDATIAAVARWVNPSSSSGISAAPAGTAAAIPGFGPLLQQLPQQGFDPGAAPGLVAANSNGCSAGLKAVTAAAADVADASCSGCYGLSFDWSHPQGPLLVPDVHNNNSYINSSSTAVAVAPLAGEGDVVQASRGAGAGLWLAVWLGVGMEPRQLMLGGLRLSAAMAMCLLHPAVSAGLVVMEVIGDSHTNAI